VSEIFLIPIPEDAECQEASMLSGKFYIPCGKKVEVIIYHERDRRGYLMCHACASHNVRNRGGKWVTGIPETEYLREGRETG
jgi:hypothetical protein